MMTTMRAGGVAVLAAALLTTATPAARESGADLWLRYAPIADSPQRDAWRARATAIVSTATSPTGRLAADELRRGLAGLLGRAVPVVAAPPGAPGALIVGTPDTNAVIAQLARGHGSDATTGHVRLKPDATDPSCAGLDLAGALACAGDEGFVLRTTTVDGQEATLIASRGEAGALYGAFAYLRLLQTARAAGPLDHVERPRMALRLLNHWDNLDGSIERGYAGPSLWGWDDLPAVVSPRIAAYGRANASLGINGTVLNNVNAQARSLSHPYLLKAKAVADVLRPYGIRVYLSANFAAPKTIGGLPVSDPLDPAVARWWREKAGEIYGLIPDFGGFLVKANSEGQPGPQDYGRTHADGANVLADAVAPHGGIVMWRAFVYDPEVDPDRVKRAYLEFKPLDGRFRDNVLVQVKNGPLDFQPREPFSPLFGAVPKTPLVAELQVTQEYLGHSTHLVYLAPMWREFLDADTFAAGPGSTVAKVVDGSLHRYPRSGMAGVANTGRETNWTGHDFGQANWYAYGRLAWNPDLTSEAIADEWIAMTWTRDRDAAAAIRSLMLDSHETYVRYTMPLGLHHLIGGDHYAPMPENPDPRRLDWSAIYYHRADATGVGVDRTTRGTAFVDQYFAPLRHQWNDPSTTPLPLLLWFHRLPWDYRLPSGATLWDGIVAHYQQGAVEAAKMVTRWEALRGTVDDERHEAVRLKLRHQAADAAAWRDHCLRYFQQFSRRPIKDGS